MEGEIMGRVVFWYSHGAASTYAIVKGLEKLRKAGDSREVVIAYCDVEDEHEDNKRYAADCEKLFGMPILFLRNEKYKGSVDEVIKQTRYMSGVRGARCTAELKKQVRRNFEEPDDLNVFGFHAGEEHRMEQLLDSEPLGEFWSPLIDDGINKKECLDFVAKSGIEIPAMYRLGYNNNNCKGCLKASGAGYWNKIRVDFPDVFKKRAKQEELLNVALVKISTSSLLEYRSELYNFLYERSIGEIKEIKVEGKGRTPFNKETSRFENCVFLPISLAEQFGIKPKTLYKKDEMLAVNTYELFNELSGCFAKLIKNSNLKIKSIGGQVRVPLRYLPEQAGNHKTEHSWDCGIFCSVNETEHPQIAFNI